MRLALILLLFGNLTFAAPGQLPPQSVILITLDGVQTNRLHHLPSVLKMVKERGFSFGYNGSEMEVSNNSSKSLPGYRAILSGIYESKCKTNKCDAIDRETIFDELPALGVPKNQSAVFASWETIQKAVSPIPENYCGSIGFSILNLCNSSDALTTRLQSIVANASLDKPRIWTNSRHDHFTWEMATAYLNEQNPRFTYLSFVETDEWAHHHRFDKVEESLKDFDQRFVSLLELLQRTPGRLENTSIVITTDHGRGRGIFRGTHGHNFPNSKKIFAFVLPSTSLANRFRIAKGAPLESSGYRQVQIKPTLEFLLNPLRKEPSPPSLVHIQL